jgi:[ribosomal protein S18]-alanine N-acetyltransferase
VKWLRRLGMFDDHPRIGPVLPGHAERLSDIHAGAFARPWSAGDFEAFLIDQSVQIDGLFIGRAQLPSGFVVSRIVLDEAEILSVALARSARGQGHARPLLTRHLQRLAHAGVARVHLEVEEGNNPALALYRKLGFEQCGVRQGYYARPDGTRASALSMTRILADAPGGSRR